MLEKLPGASLPTACITATPIKEKKKALLSLVTENRGPNTLTRPASWGSLLHPWGVLKMLQESFLA